MLLRIVRPGSLGLALVLLLLLSGHPGTTYAATIIVNTTTDVVSDDGL